MHFGREAIELFDELISRPKRPKDHAPLSDTHRPDLEARRIETRLACRDPKKLLDELVGYFCEEDGP